MPFENDCSKFARSPLDTINEEDEFEDLDYYDNEASMG